MPDLSFLLDAKDRASAVVRKFGRNLVNTLSISERATSRSIRAFTAFRGSIAGSIGALVSLKGAIVGAGLGLLARQVVKAATAQEDAINKLNNALETTGMLTEELSLSTQRLASSLQAQTRFGDEAILSAQALLVTYGVTAEKLEEATKATLDFAAATGRDLNTAALTVGKAAAGFTGELTRYGIVVDTQGIPKTQVFQRVLERMNVQFGGRAQADVETFSGRLAQFSNVTGDLLEVLGEAIIKSKSFRDAIGDFTIGLNVAIEELRKLNKEASAAGNAIATMTPSGETAIETIFGLRGAALQLGRAVDVVKVGFAKLIIFTNKNSLEARSAQIILDEATKSYADSTNAIERNRQALEDSLKRLTGVRDAQDDLAKSTGKTTKGIKAQSDVLSKLFKIPAEDAAVNLALTKDAFEAFAKELPELLGIGFEEGLEDTGIILQERLRIDLLDRFSAAKFEFSKLSKDVKFSILAAIPEKEDVAERMDAFVEATEKALAKIKRVKDKAAEEEEKRNKKENRLRNAQFTLGAQLVRTFGALAEATGKKGFANSKAIRIAEAIINTAGGIVRAFNDHPFPLSAVIAATVAAAGVAQIATIASTNIGSGGGVTAPSIGGGGVAAAGGGVAVAAPAPAGPSFQITVTGFVGDEARLAEELARIQREAISDGITFSPA